MRENLRDIVRRVLSSSLLVSGTAAPAAAAEVIAVPTEFPANIAEAKLLTDGGEMVLRDRRPRLILKRAAEATLELVSSHRSHRSHSSHRSHYSSSGGRTTPSRPRTSPPPVYNPPSGTYSTAEFGQRVLRRGMRGADVAELMRLLVVHGHLSRDSVNTEALFTRAVEDAVRSFQRSRNVSADGIVGSTTALLLRRRPDGN